MSASGKLQSATPAPWIERQLLALLQQRGHAWLLQGPSGLGQLTLSMALASAWLCEQKQTNGLACGQCASCHAIHARTHADLLVLMPEVHMMEQGWALDEKAQKELDEKKRKPSKEIRIDAMRAAVEFAQRTSSRNQGKVVLVYPAERMNAVTANALLKTLEEPAGDTRFVLASEAAYLLLPTIRSRCMMHTLHWPTPEEALQWLLGQGMHQADATTLLEAAGGRPEDALELAAQGINAAIWQKLPQAVRAGDASVLGKFPPTQVIGILQKLCHDLQALKAGATPRFFEKSSLPQNTELVDWQTLTAWAKELAQTARSSEHPYMAGLLLEDLLTQAARVLRTDMQIA